MQNTTKGSKSRSTGTTKACKGCATRSKAQSATSPERPSPTRGTQSGKRSGTGPSATRTKSSSGQPTKTRS